MTNFLKYFIITLSCMFISLFECNAADTWAISSISTNTTMGDMRKQIIINPFNIKTLTQINTYFYIADVVDLRQDQENIGVTNMIKDIKDAPVEIKDGFRTTLMNYFNATLPKADTKVPIIIKVLNFNSSEEEFKDITKSTGNVENTSYSLKVIARLDFYIKIDNKEGKIYEVNSSTVSVIMAKTDMPNVIDIYEKNINSTLVDCINSFTNYIRDTNKIEFQNIVTATKDIAFDKKENNRESKYMENWLRDWGKANGIGFYYCTADGGNMIEYEHEKTLKYSSNYLNLVSYSIGYYWAGSRDIDIKDQGSTYKGKFDIQALPYSICYYHKVKKGAFSGKWGIGGTLYEYSGAIDFYGKWGEKYSGTYTSNFALDAVIPFEGLLEFNDENLGPSSFVRINAKAYFPVTKASFSADAGYTSSRTITDVVPFGGYFIGISMGKYFP